MRKWLRDQVTFLSIWILVLLVAPFFAAWLVRPDVPPAAFEYSAAEYAPAIGTLCPGDILTWHALLHVEASPDNAVITDIGRSVWSEERNEMVVRDIPLRRSVFLAPTETHMEEQYEIPADLAPGDYALHTGLRTAGRQEKGYRVPFSILPPEQCATPGSAPQGGTP